MVFETWFSSQHPRIPIPGANAVITLLKEGATLPFIARYRKEATGNLKDVQIEEVAEAHTLWETLLKRQQTILSQIESQNKLTEELKQQILSTFDLNELEDIYLPYKKRRRTKAQIAREKGLEPLANWIWDCGQGITSAESGVSLEQFAEKFVNKVSDAEKAVNNIGEAIAGAQDILAEKLSEMQELRGAVRQTLLKSGELHATKGDKVKPNSKFETYFKHEELLSSLLKPASSHRYLALRRGQKEGELKVTITTSDSLLSMLLEHFEKEAIKTPGSPGESVLKDAAKIAFQAYVLPSLENEMKAKLKEIADAEAIKVFAGNVKKVLLEAPFGAKPVLGVDPGIRTGCKLAIIDEKGKFIGSFVLMTQNDRDKEQSEILLSNLVASTQVAAVAVGNGTAGRETEAFIRQVFAKHNVDVPVVMVSEAGASVYSASETAREEFPDLDVTIRGAISIARRLQDPLAELVKVDPKSIGVGQYQHDVSQAALKESLNRVVESCVNSVGVNLNTSSYHLLAFVSGIGPVLAKNIVTYRETHGLFKNREELKNVDKFGEKAFEQAAGFLRVPGSTNPLDNTGVHPERYAALEEYANKIGKSIGELLGEGVAALKESAELKAALGEFTFKDVIDELAKPGRDIRDKFVPFSFHPDLKEIGDLKKDMLYPGIVTNVTNFGAFVDVGVHQDGLVHLSELADRFVKDPAEVVSPGDRVTVKLLEVDVEKKRISFTMRTQPKPAARPKDAPRQDRPREDRRPKQARPQGPRPENRGPGRGPDRGPNRGGDKGPRPPKPNRERAKDLTHNPFASALAGFKIDKK